MTDLEKRITEIAYALKLTHLSAYYTAVNLLDGIYKSKKKDEPLILSQGHSFVALAVVLEKYEGKDAMALAAKYMTHPRYCPEDGIWCSTGSLGQGVTIAVGMALADRSKNVYLFTSDGEMCEGCCWEALKIAADLRLENLRITVNANGYSAYDKQDVDMLDARMQLFYPSLVIRTNMFKYPDEVQGVSGHYAVMDEKLHEKFKKL